MKIIGIDLMGSDLGPEVIIKGIKEYLQNKNNIVKLVLYLTIDIKEKVLKELDGISEDNLVICENYIDANDGALVARRKDKATFVQAINDLSNNKIHTIISTCNTKAMVATASAFLKKISISSKVAIASFLQRSDGKEFFITDVGARVNYTPQDFVSLAKYGLVMMKNFKNNNNPTMRLINIGEEQGKGDQLHIEADKLLRAEFPNNYKGNMDPYMLMTHENDIILTDGFSGNLVSKSFEGGVELISSEIKKIASKNIRNKIALLSIKKDLKEAIFKYDYRSRGAAYLFGFEQLVLKAHGRSDSVAIKNAIGTAILLLENNVINNLISSIRPSTNSKQG